jgi:uncharacterized protein (TIGR03000 family)
MLRAENVQGGKSVTRLLLVLSMGLALLLSASTQAAPQDYQSYRLVFSWPSASTAAIDVKVPAEAILWFQGQKTRQRGSERFFQSPPLMTGKSYDYQIKALWIDEKGEKIERIRTLQVQAGEHLSIDLRND